MYFSSYGLVVFSGLPRYLVACNFAVRGWSIRKEFLCGALYLADYSLAHFYFTFLVQLWPCVLPVHGHGCVLLVEPKLQHKS